MIDCSNVIQILTICTIFWVCTVAALLKDLQGLSHNASKSGILILDSVDKLVGSNSYSVREISV